MELITKRNGIALCIIGLILFLGTSLALSWWNIDTDIFGIMVLILGLVMTIAMWKGPRTNRGWLTRKKGVWLCVIGVLIMLLTGFITSINGDNLGMIGIGVFFSGIILVVLRWRY